MKTLHSIPKEKLAPRPRRNGGWVALNNIDWPNTFNINDFQVRFEGNIINGTGTNFRFTTTEDV